MKYGCCVNMLPKEVDKTGIEYVRQLKELGYDYVEMPLNEVAKLSDEQFEEMLLEMKKIGLPCRCCNDFMPSSFRIVGEELTDDKTLLEYMNKAMDRVRRLGAGYAVYGSPWSRVCPEGFSREKAFDQIADFLRKVGDVAAKNNVIVVVEHNNSSETNMLNHFSDVLRIVEKVNHPNVQALCDYFHLRYEKDTPDVLLPAKGRLRHTHMAQFEGRRYLTDLAKEPMLPEYARVLHAIGYEGGISMEAKVDSHEGWLEDARVCLENLKKVFD